MQEREELKPDQIEIAKEQAKFFIRGKKDELQTELDDVKTWPGSVQTRGGNIKRKEREIHHLEMRIKDWDHADKLFSEILESLRKQNQ